MRKSSLKPLGVVKQEAILRLLSEAIESAKLTNADFGSLGRANQLPTQERQVTKFIRERTRLYRESWIVSPLATIVEMINENAEDGDTPRAA